MKCSPMEMYADPLYWIILLIVSCAIFGIWALVDKMQEEKKD